MMDGRKLYLDIRMKIWKVLGILATGVSLILFASIISQYNYRDQILTIIAGIGVAIFAMLAFIADMISASKE